MAIQIPTRSDYDNPEYNLLALGSDPKTFRHESLDLTATVNSDGSITLNGTYPGIYSEQAVPDVSGIINIPLDRSIYILEGKYLLNIELISNPNQTIYAGTEVPVQCRMPIIDANSRISADVRFNQPSYYSEIYNAQYQFRRTAITPVYYVIDKLQIDIGAYGKLFYSNSQPIDTFFNNFTFKLKLCCVSCTAGENDLPINNNNNQNTQDDATDEFSIDDVDLTNYDNPEYDLLVPALAAESGTARNISHESLNINAAIDDIGNIILNGEVTSQQQAILTIPLKNPIPVVEGSYAFGIRFVDPNEVTLSTFDSTSTSMQAGTTIPIWVKIHFDWNRYRTWNVNIHSNGAGYTTKYNFNRVNDDPPYLIIKSIEVHLGFEGHIIENASTSPNDQGKITSFHNKPFKLIFKCLSRKKESDNSSNEGSSDNTSGNDDSSELSAFISPNHLGTMTNKLESFLDNNSPGGFVQTSINISSDDLSTRINTILQNKNFLSVNSRINYSQIDNAPVFADIALSGEYEDLKHSPELASVATTGNYNDLRNKPIISGNNGGNNQRQIYYNELVGAPTLATVAITGSYNDLTDKPNSFATVAFSGNFNDLDFVPNFVERENLSNAAFSGDYHDLLNTPENVDSDDIIYHFDISNTDCQPLKYLANNLVNTTTVLSQQNNANYTVESFLIDLMNTYFDTPEIDPNDDTKINLNHYQSSVVIKVTTFLGDMILTGIHQQDSSFVFTFTPLDMNTYLLTTKTDEHITGNDAQAETILNELTPNYFYPVLIFVPMKHELWIKRMTLILQEQLKTVAVTGSYNDLIDTPQLKKVATTGAYIDLEGVPALKPVATSGSYNDLINRPTLAEVATSGSYNDLINRPTLAEVATTGSYNSLADVPILSAVALSGSYNSLEDRPSLADVALTGSYLNLTNRPDFATVAFTGSYNNLLDKPIIAQSDDIVKIFNVGNFSSNLLKTFSPGEINTTGRISNDVDASTINNWLEDIINAYKYNNVFNLNIIKITNNKKQLILTYIEENNDIYIFHFTPVSENNLQQLINDNIPLTENNITFSNYFVYFIYDKSRDKLFIYNKNIT